MTSGPLSQSNLLRQYGIKPVKRRGQNFLVDGNLARAIAQDVLKVSDLVLELGAGGGALTKPLLDGGAKKVLCVEVDRNLCALLQSEFQDQAAFALLSADLAKLDWQETINQVGPSPVIAGNLPYVLTSTVLFALADLRDQVSGGVFMVQKEVAGRMVASAGSRSFGVLSVVLGAVFDIEVVRNVPPEVFWPRPEVASAVVKLLPGDVWPQEEFENFTATVRLAFGQRRKKIRSVLKGRFGYPITEVDKITQAADIDANLRPEQLEISQWRRLAEVMAQHPYPKNIEGDNV